MNIMRMTLNFLEPCFLDNAAALQDLVNLRLID